MNTKKNILLVDDDQIANFLNEQIITHLGLANEIHTAVNGKEALEIFNRYFSGTIAIPDVILLDLNMPIMDGFEFIRAFQQLNFPHKEKVLIIIVTSSNNPEDMKKAESMGIKYYLTKPISPEHIQSIILKETSP